MKFLRETHHCHPWMASFWHKRLITKEKYVKRIVREHADVPQELSQRSGNGAGEPALRPAPVVPRGSISLTGWVAFVRKSSGEQAKPVAGRDRARRGGRDLAGVSL